MFDLKKIAQLAIIAGGSLAAWFTWLSSVKSKAVTEYQSRVVIEERKIDAKAKAARKRAVSDADRVLERYYRD